MWLETAEIVYRQPQNNGADTSEWKKEPAGGFAHVLMRGGRIYRLDRIEVVAASEQTYLRVVYLPTDSAT